MCLKITKPALRKDTSPGGNEFHSYSAHSITCDINSIYKFWLSELILMAAGKRTV